MSRKVKKLTGTGETDRWGAKLTDLGFPTKTRHGYTITLFGDTFEDYSPDGTLGTNWRSPVGLRQHNADIHNGIRWDNAIGGATAKQMIDYEHRGDIHHGELPDGFTNIPNDMIHLPDGRYVMTTFAVKSWDYVTPGKGMATFHSRMWTSTETHAEFWNRTWDNEGHHTNFDFPNWGEWSHFQNNTMIMFRDEPWVYIYGTNEGRWKGGGIHLMRVHWQHIFDRSHYEFWGIGSDRRWGWRRGGNTTPIILPPSHNQYIGEINAQVIEDRVVLSYYLDAQGAVTQTSPRPEGLWTTPRTHVDAQQQSFAYAPAIHPYSSLSNAQMLLSKWNEREPSTYGVHQWSVDLREYSSNPWGLRAQGTEEPGTVPEGYGGPVSPELFRLPVSEQAAVLADNSETTPDRNDLKRNLSGAGTTQPLDTRSERIAKKQGTPTIAARE